MQSQLKIISYVLLFSGCSLSIGAKYFSYSQQDFPRAKSVLSTAPPQNVSDNAMQKRLMQLLPDIGITHSAIQLQITSRGDSAHRHHIRSQMQFCGIDIDYAEMNVHYDFTGKIVAITGDDAHSSNLIAQHNNTNCEFEAVLTEQQVQEYSQNKLPRQQWQFEEVKRVWVSEAELPVWYLYITANKSIEQYQFWVKDHKKMSLVKQRKIVIQ